MSRLIFGHLLLEIAQKFSCMSNFEQWMSKYWSWCNYKPLLPSGCIIHLIGYFMLSISSTSCCVVKLFLPSCTLTTRWAHRVLKGHSHPWWSFCWEGYVQVTSLSPVYYHYAFSFNFIFSHYLHCTCALLMIIHSLVNNMWIRLW